jgi:translocation and assembly module TamB
LAIEGVDVKANVEWDPEKHDVRGSVELHDARAPLAAANATLTLPSSAALTELTNWKRIRAWPIQAQLQLAQRRTSSLPAGLRAIVAEYLAPAKQNALGFQAVVMLEGTLLNPKVRANASVDGIALAEDVAPASAVPKGVPATAARQEQASIRVAGEFASPGGQVHVDVVSRTGPPVLQLATSWTGDLRRLGEVQPGVVAKLQLGCQQLPLQWIPSLADQGLRGGLSGSFQLDDWGKNAVAHARLWSRGLEVGTVAIPALAIEGDAKGEQLTAQVKIQSGQGRAELAVASAVRWEQRWLPQLMGTLRADLSAKRFELGALRPLLGRQVNELSGTLDGQLHAALGVRQTEVTGGLEVRDGVVQVPFVGQRFSQIDTKLAVTRDRLTIEHFNARGVTGRIEASGEADLVGFDVRRAQLAASIPKRSKLPLTIEGVVLGDAWGRVRLDYDNPTSGAPHLKVSVPTFELLTPDVDSGSLQTLEPHQDVRVGARRADGEFAEVAVQPLEADADTDSTAAQARPSRPPMRIEIELGDITVHKGDVATARLSGALLAVDGQVTGRIELTGGSIDVEGKRFEVDHGVISFNGTDASNPSIAATARWDSPTGHSVYAEYIGDVKNGQIKLHSEPPLTQDQIASLLLFGSPDGSFGSTPTDEASMAVGVAGGTVAKGLNHALSRFSKLDVSTRVDSSNGSSRPEIVVQVSPRVTAKLSRALGEPTAGEAPDRTFVTLELRLQRSWALSALLGDHGASAFDLIWRRRY